MPNNKNALGNSKIGTPFCCRKSRDQFRCSGDFSRYASIETTTIEVL